MAIPIFNLHGPFHITIRMPEANRVVVQHSASNDFILFERPHAPAEERYHVRWFDLVSQQQENYFGRSYSVTNHGRKYTVVNDYEFYFIFERVAGRTET